MCLRRTYPQLPVRIFCWGPRRATKHAKDRRESLAAVVVSILGSVGWCCCGVVAFVSRFSYSFVPPPRSLCAASIISGKIILGCWATPKEKERPHRMCVCFPRLFEQSTHCFLFRCHERRRTAMMMMIREPNTFPLFFFLFLPPIFRPTTIRTTCTCKSGFIVRVCVCVRLAGRRACDNSSNATSVENRSCVCVCVVE